MLHQLLCNDRTRMCATGYKDYTDYEQNYTHSTTAGEIQTLISSLPLVSKEEAQVNSHTCTPFSELCSFYAKNSQKLRRFGSTKCRKAVLYKVPPFLCLPRVLFPLDFPWRQYGKVCQNWTKIDNCTQWRLGNGIMYRCNIRALKSCRVIETYPCSKCLQNSLKQNSPANKKLQTGRTNAHRNAFQHTAGRKEVQLGQQVFQFPGRLIMIMMVS